MHEDWVKRKVRKSLNLTLGLYHSRWTQRRSDGVDWCVVIDSEAPM